MAARLIVRSRVVSRLKAHRPAHLFRFFGFPSISSSSLLFLLALLLVGPFSLLVNPATGQTLLNPFEKFENRGLPKVTPNANDQSPLDTFNLNRSARARSLSTNPFEALSTETRQNVFEARSNQNANEPNNQQSTFRSNSAESSSSIEVPSNQTSSGLRHDSPNRNSVSSNPAMDDILSGLIQLIGGNVKLNNRQTNGSPNNNNNGGNLPFPPGLIPPQLAANPALLAQFASRLPNRLQMLPNLPHFLPGQGPANLLPPNVLIGPSRVPLPLHFPHKSRLPFNNNNNQSPSTSSPNAALNFQSHGTNHGAISNQNRPNGIPQSSSTTHALAPFPGINHISLPNSPPLNPSQLASLLSGYSNSNNALAIPFNELLAQANLNRTQSLPSSLLNPNRIIKVEANEVSRLLGITKPSSSSLSSVATSTEIELNLQPSSLPDNDFSVPSEPALQTSFGFTSSAIDSTASSSTVTEAEDSSATLPTPTIAASTLEASPTVIANHHRGGSLPARPIPPIELTPDLADKQNDLNVQNWQPFNHQSSSISLPTRQPSPSNTPDIITKPDEPTVFDITVRHKLGHTSDDTSTSSLKPQSSDSTPIASKTSSTLSQAIRPSSTVQIDMSTSSIANKPTDSRSFARPRPSSAVDAEVVYGRHVQNEAKHTPSVSSSSGTAPFPSSTATPPLPANDLTEVTGRPYVIPVQVDQVRPALSSNEDNQQLLSQPGQGSVYIESGQKHFKLKPVQRVPSIQVSSAVNILPVSDSSFSNSKPSSSSSNNESSNSSTSSSNGLATPSHTPPRTASAGSRSRAPPPPVRIDTCIVGDDSTCGSAALERCRTEGGISSCHCRPGLGRASLRAPCVPATTLALQVRLDRLHGQKVSFSPHLLDPNSADFQKLESATSHALHTLISASRLARSLLTVRVRRFAPASDKAMANVTVLLTKGRDASASSMSVLRAQLASELTRLVGAGRASALPLTLDSSVSPRVEDLDECADPTLNDCSKYAKCINELGGFSCVCRPGYEDRALVASSGASSSNSAILKQMRPGRVCSGCSTTHCSGRGECQVVDGQRVCKCRGNYMGSRCELDAEVLAVAFGGSLAALIIIIITFLCLYIWNQKWKTEQQKMEAMSSGSGQTFSYVNKAAVGTNFRLGMEERMRGWSSTFEPAVLQTNASNYNFYVNPEQVLASSQQHVYATPSRVQTPDHLLAEEQQAHMYNTRRKSRTCTLPQAYSSMNYPGTAGIYNETEFSTRETMYAPSHLILPSRPKYAMY